MVELFDRALILFEKNAKTPAIIARYPEATADGEQLDYMIRLLIALSQDGATTFTTPLNDQVAITGFDPWLHLFSSVILDALSSKSSELLLSGLDGDAVAQQYGEALRDLLQYHLPEGLRSAGYEPIPAFPLCNLPVQPGMQVVGSEGRKGYESQIVRVSRYGLMLNRAVVREAHVTTG